MAKIKKIVSPFLTREGESEHIWDHTEGDWLVMPGEAKPRICVDGDKEWPIVLVISGHSDKGIKANERLIASAPGLLGLLYQGLSSGIFDDAPMFKRDVKAEIYNATGKSFPKL